MLAVDLEKYDEAQPRDELGRWSSGGGNAARVADLAAQNVHVNLDHVDPVLQTMVLDAAQSFRDRFPRIPLLVGIRSGVQGEVASAQGYALNLSPEWYGPGGAARFDAAEARDRAAHWSAEPTARGTIEHEFGHILDWMTYFEASNDTFGGNARAAETGSGRRDVRERFAEAFSQLWMRPADEWTTDAQRVAEALATRRDLPGYLAEQPGTTVYKYDESEPRDSHGRWTSAGDDTMLAGRDAESRIRQMWPHATVRPGGLGTVNRVLLNQAVHTLGELHTRYPDVEIRAIGVVRSGLGSGRDTLAVSSPDQQLALNEPYWKNGLLMARASEQGGLVRPEGMTFAEATITHEFGHLVDSQYFGGRAGGAGPGAHVDNLMHGGGIPFESRYAQTSTGEAWAEAFVQHVAGADTPGARWVEARLAGIGLKVEKVLSPLTFADRARLIIARGYADAYAAGYDDSDPIGDELDAQDIDAAVDDVVESTGSKLPRLAVALIGGAISARLLNAWLGGYAASLGGVYQQGFGSGVETLGETISATWITEEDGIVCPMCDERDGMVWYGDEPHPYPGEGYFGEQCAGGPNCRCRIEYDVVPVYDLNENPSNLPDYTAVEKYSEAQPRDELGRWVNGDKAWRVKAALGGWMFNSTGTRDIRQTLSRGLPRADRGVDRVVDLHARVLLDAVAEGTPAPQIYRGISFPYPSAPYERLKSMGPGDVIDLNLSSWTEDKAHADWMAGQNPYQVHFTLEPGATTLEAGRYAPDDPEHEHLTDGRFVVVDASTAEGAESSYWAWMAARVDDFVPASGGDVNLTLRQRGVFTTPAETVGLKILTKYDPDQPRGYDGRWIGGGATGPNPDPDIHLAAVVWADGLSGPIRDNLRRANEHAIVGEFERDSRGWQARDQLIQTGTMLLNAANASAPTTYPLYRGLGFNLADVNGHVIDRNYDAFRREVRVGAVVPLNLSSWTRDPGVARQFASNSFGTAAGTSGGYPGLAMDQVTFVVEPGAHALDATHDIPQGPQYTEHLMAGLFEVTDLDSEVVHVSDGLTRHVVYLRQVGLLDAAGVVGTKIVKYAPDQPRDDHGRWTDGGGWVDPGPRPPLGVPPDEFTPEQMDAYYAARHAEKQAWTKAMNYGVAMGLLDPQEAAARDWYTNAHNGPQTMPDTLYHATPAMDAVLAGGLKTRDEMGGGTSGLGGGDSDTISFTTDPALAGRIAEVLVEAHDVAVGDITIADLYERAKEGGFDGQFVNSVNQLQGPFDLIAAGTMTGPSQLPTSLEEQVARYGDLGWHPAPDAYQFGTPDAPKWQQWERPQTAEETAQLTFDMYRYSFLTWQEQAGRGADPMIFSPSLEAYRAIDPADVGVVEAHPVPGAMGFQMGGMSEWRTWTGDAVTISAVKGVRPDVVKYDESEPRDDRGRWTDGGDLPSLPKIGDGQPFGASFSREQTAALWRYTQYDYGVNGWLRRGPSGFAGGSADDYPQMAAALASAARPLPEDGTLLRGVEREAFGLDSIESSTLQVDDRLHELVGQTVRDRGFMSSTTNPETDYYTRPEIHLHIAVPAGTPVIAVGDAGVIKYRDEQEHILPPDTGLKLTRVQMNEDPEAAYSDYGHPTWDVWAQVVP